MDWGKIGASVGLIFTGIFFGLGVFANIWSLLSKDTVPRFFKNWLNTPEKKIRFWTISSLIEALALLVLLSSLLLFPNFSSFASESSNGSERQPTPTQSTTATAFPSYIPGRGTLVVYDPMVNNSRGYQWQKGTTPIDNGNPNPGSCQFASDGYHIQADNYYYACLEGQDDLKNFVFEVQMSHLPGSAGGLSFRDAGHGTYDVDLGPSGHYSIENPTNTFLRKNTLSPLIPRSRPSYLVDIEVSGNRITLYIDKMKIDSLTDKTSSHGYIGLYVTTDGGTSQTEVVFTNVKVWNLM